jgi:antitoxin VapB
MHTAKIFWNGKSQAVRLPKECRFDGNEVYIKKIKDGVLLSQKPQADWAAFFCEHDPCSDFEIDRPDNIAPQERNILL